MGYIYYSAIYDFYNLDSFFRRRTYFVWLVLVQDKILCLVDRLAKISVRCLFVLDDKRARIQTYSNGKNKF